MFSRIKGLDYFWTGIGIDVGGVINAPTTMFLDILKFLTGNWNRNVKNIPRNCIRFFCPTPWPEAKSKWYFLAYGQGGGHDIFSTSFNFQCATPRGLIRWVTVGGNYSLFGHFGFNSKFLMCYLKGAHLLGHRWGQIPTFWAFWIQFQIFNVLPQGGSFVGSPWGAITHFWVICDSV